MTALLDRIDATELDVKTKGCPVANVRLGDVGQQGWNVRRGDLMLPVLTISDPKLRNNLQVMRRYVEHHKVSLAPHGKSTFCPQLYVEQVTTGGSWGISAATVQQASLVAEAGISNVLIVNEVIGKANVAQLVALKHAHPDKAFYTLVDTEGALHELARHSVPMLGPGERFQVLVEVGFPGGRAGVRSLEQGIALVDAIMAQREIFDLAGVECYEGLVSRPDQSSTLAAIDRLLDLTVEIYRAARQRGAFDERAEAILTAGGSVYFDRVVKRFSTAQLDPGTRVILRGGSSVTYDHGRYDEMLALLDERGGLDMPEGRVNSRTAFTPALAIWSAVVTLQDEGVAVLAMGIRDLPFDMGLPKPLEQYRDGVLVQALDAGDAFRVTAANDQHCYMAYPPGHDIAVGDIIACGISHPCTAFDKWDVVWRIDSDGNVTGALKTYF
jgi:D-serine dehydratase